MKSLIIFISTTLMFYVANAQISQKLQSSDGTSEKLFSPTQLKKDFEVFRGAFEEMHPGLYWYNSKKEMDEVFDITLASLNHKMSELTFYRKLSLLISKIGCGHTWPWITDQQRELIWRQGKTFPIQMKFINDKAYCIQNNSEDSLSIRPGDEILRINGQPVMDVIERMNAHGPGDGYINTQKWIRHERLFHFYYTLYIDQPETYHLEIIDQSKKKKQIKVNALAMEQINQIRQIRYGETETNPHYISLQLLQDHDAALLKITSFNNWKVGKKKYHFQKELQACFEKINDAGIQNLIIDVRDNDGGVEKYGLKLLSYLRQQPFVGYRSIDFKTTKFKYRKYSNTGWFEYGLYKAVLQHKKVNDTTFQLQNDKVVKEFRPSSPHYAGKTFVLMNGHSYSTTGDFVALAHDMRLATFIGEESGGGYQGNSGNYEFLVTLPNTDIRIFIPIARYWTNVAEPTAKGRGTMPDYHIKPSLDDSLKGVDTELNFTIDLINNTTNE